MYKKLKRGGLTPGLKNYVKKEDSQEKMIAVVDKKDGLEKFVKKSEVMKEPRKYFPSNSSYEAALQIAKTKEPGSRLSVLILKENAKCSRKNNRWNVKN
jgi:hypothetical protein